MSLQFIIGSSGAGKSYFAYERVIRESMEHPERNYYIIVPEQFTMQTQKTLVEMHPGKGILNIDILSFERLAYRVFEETGGDNRKVLEDTGKSMVLQKMVQQHGTQPAMRGWICLRQLDPCAERIRKELSFCLRKHIRQTRCSH